MARSLSPKAAKAKAEMISLIDALEVFTEESEDDDRVMESLARFAQHYSERNALLIVMQRPSATEVHGYRAWQAKGRQVLKGAKGIRILAPAGNAPATVTTAPNGDEQTKRGRQFFRLISVFDIRQTEPMEDTPQPSE